MTENGSEVLLLAGYEDGTVHLFAAAAAAGGVGDSPWEWVPSHNHLRISVFLFFLFFLTCHDLDPISCSDS